MGFGMIRLVIKVLTLLIHGGSFFGETKTKERGSKKRVIKVVSTTNCCFYLDGELVGVGQAGKVTKVSLEKQSRFLQLKHLRDGRIQSDSYPVDIQTKQKRLLLVNLPFGSLLNYSGSQYEDPLAGSFLLVEGGTFRKGYVEETAGIYPGNHPLKIVTLSSFYLGKKTVTAGQWLAVMGSLPTAASKKLASPVVGVSWTEIQEFLARLNALTGNVQYRLPTDAEWEYAYKWGDQSIDYSFWADDEPEMEKDPRAHEWKAYELKSTKLGLIQMGYEFWEWCSDWYESDPPTAPFNPTGPLKGTKKVYRGKIWDNFCYGYEPVDRHGDDPDFRHPELGFRLARTP